MSLQVGSRAAIAAMLLETPAEEVAGRQLAKAFDMYSLALMQPLAELEASASACPLQLQPAQKGILCPVTWPNTSSLHELYQTCSGARCGDASGHI